jgi:hypothetical protein
MWVLQFETLHGKSNHKQEKIKSMQYLHIQIGLCTKGSFHESGQCNYIKILNYNFSLRLLCGYFMIKIMKYCLNVVAWSHNVLTLLNEGITHLVYSTNVIHS